MTNQNANNRDDRSRKLELLVKKLFELEGKRNVKHNVIVRGRQIDVCFSKYFTQYFVEVKYKQSQGIVDYRYVTGFIHLLKNHFDVDVNQGIMVTNGYYDVGSWRLSKDGGLQIYDRFDLEKLSYWKLGFWDKRKATKLWKKVDCYRKEIIEAEIELYGYKQELGEPASFSQMLKRKCFGNYYRKRAHGLREEIEQYRDLMKPHQERLDKFYQENEIPKIEEYIEMVK